MLKNEVVCICHGDEEDDKKLSVTKFGVKKGSYLWSYEHFDFSVDDVCKYYDLTPPFVARGEILCLFYHNRTKVGMFLLK